MLSYLLSLEHLAASSSFCFIHKRPHLLFTFDLLTVQGWSLNHCPHSGHLLTHKGNKGLIMWKASYICDVTWIVCIVAFHPRCLQNPTYVRIFLNFSLVLLPFFVAPPLSCGVSQEYRVTLFLQSGPEKTVPMVHFCTGLCTGYHAWVLVLGVCCVHCPPRRRVRVDSKVRGPHTVMTFVASCRLVPCL